MVSKPDYYLNLNLCDSQTQSLASCELLVWNFFKCFLTLKRVPFKLRYCSIFKVLCAAPSRVGSSFIISREVPFVKHFFEIFSEPLSSALPLKGCPIILPLRHLNVNTFFHVFSSFFAVGSSAAFFAPLAGSSRPALYLSAIYPSSPLLYRCGFPICHLIKSKNGGAFSRPENAPPCRLQKPFTRACIAGHRIFCAWASGLRSACA